VRKGQDQDLIVVRLKEITESSSEAPSGVRVRKQPVEAESIKAKVRALASPRSDKAESKGSLEMSNPVIRVHYPDGSVHTGEKGDGTLEDLDPNRIANMNVTKPADGSRPRIDVYVKDNSIGESDKTKQSPMAAVGQMPRFPGCEASDLGAKAREKCAAQKMIGFLRSELRYPEGARKQEVEGMVVVEFTVGRDGAVRSPKVIQSLSPDCDAEALRVVLAMPKWVPGQKEGEPVAVTMKLPFKFALPAKDKELPAVQSSVLDLAEFSIAPNPSSGNVRVKFSAEAMPTRLVISDMQGRALLTRDLEDFDGYYDQRLDLDPFAAGPLVLVISQGDKVFSRRIVLEE
jgi:TonB family protein